MGAKVRTIFVDFVRMLKPSYASITIDAYLPRDCPQAFCRDGPRKTHS
jgi:hypothetical protein